MSDNDKQFRDLIIDHLAKQDAINEEQTKTLGEIGKCLVRQEESLKYHIKRTDLLEESVGMCRSDFIPVKRHVDLVNAGAKIFAALVGIGTGMVAILKYLL